MAPTGSIFNAMLQEFDGAARILNLEPGIWKILTHPKRQITVSCPVQMDSGESIPFSADMISAEMAGESASKFDSEFLRNAAKAVFHYFKHDLGRQSISLGEFAGARAHRRLGRAHLYKPFAQSDFIRRSHCRAAGEVPAMADGGAHAC